MDADHIPAATGRAPAPAGRCPVCAARCAPDAPWCTLCHADLRPVSPPGSAPDSAPDSPPDPPVVTPDELLLHRDAGPRPWLPLVSDLLAGPGGAVAVMLGGTALVTAGVVTLMWLLGALL